EADPAPQRGVHIRLDGAAVMQIHDPDRGVLLSQAVDAADALLDPHRVPRHVVVHHGAAELEVQALCGGIGTEEDLGPPLAEATLHVITRHGPPLSVVLYHLASAPGEAEDALSPDAAQVPAAVIHLAHILR